MTWAEHVPRMGESKGVYSILVGKPDGKRPLGRPRRRWEEQIKRDLYEVGCGGIDCIDLAQDRDSWRESVNAGRTYGLHKMRGFFLRCGIPIVLGQ